MKYEGELTHESIGLKEQSSLFIFGDSYILTKISLVQIMSFLLVSCPRYGSIYQINSVWRTWIDTVVFNKSSLNMRM